MIDSQKKTETRYSNASDNPLGCGGGTPTLWFKADVGVTESGGNVSKWADQSRNAWDADILNGTAPTYATDAWNYNPVVEFNDNGGLEGLMSTTITSNTLTVFAVAKS